MWFATCETYVPDLICPFHALYPIQENAEQAKKQELTDVLPHIHPGADKKPTSTGCLEEKVTAAVGFCSRDVKD